MHLEDYRKRKLKKSFIKKFILSDFFRLFLKKCGLIKSQNINNKLIDLVLINDIILKSIYY